MPRVETAPEVLDDLDRFFDHLTAQGVGDIAARLQALMDGLQLLAYSPLIGRPVARGQRELVIGTGARGYLARYRHVPAVDTVFVLALRHQREQGHPPGR